MQRIERSGGVRWRTVVALIVATAVLSSTTSAAAQGWSSAQSEEGEQIPTSSPVFDGNHQLIGFEFGPPEPITDRDLDTAKELAFDDDGKPQEHSLDELIKMPERVRSALIAPHSTTTETTVTDTLANGGPYFWKGFGWSGQWGDKYCTKLRLDRNLITVFDTTIMKTSIRVNEICVHDGDFIGTPDVVYYADGLWGYSFCGWTSLEEGRRHGYNYPAFAGFGTAKFAFGTKLICSLVDLAEITLGLWAYSYVRGSWIDGHYLVDDCSKWFCKLYKY